MCLLPESEDPLEKEMATYSSTLAWEISCLVGYSPSGQKGAEHDLATKKHSWLSDNTGLNCMGPLRHRLFFYKKVCSNYYSRYYMVLSWLNSQMQNCRYRAVAVKLYFRLWMVSTPTPCIVQGSTVYIALSSMVVVCYFLRSPGWCNTPPLLFSNKQNYLKENIKEGNMA